MSWALNRGPSFNTTLPGTSYNQLTGFTMRFMLTQDSPLMTPGKAEPHLPAETMSGTHKRKKGGMKKKPERCKNLVMPKVSLAPEPIYGGFAKSMPSHVKKRVTKTKPKKGKKGRFKL